MKKRKKKFGVTVYERGIIYRRYNMQTKLRAGTFCQIMPCFLVSYRNQLVTVEFLLKKKKKGRMMKRSSIRCLFERINKR